MGLAKRLKWMGVGLLAVGLVGCGSGGDNTAASGGNAAAPKKTKVALLTPGDINDQGWNQLAYEGLQAIEKEAGGVVTHQVTKTTSDQAPAIQAMAEDGNDIIICHGFEYGEKVKAIAPRYPNISFVVVAGNVTQEPNVASMVPKLEEATYLLGMAAGGVTKSSKVGAIGGGQFPVIKSTFDAFALGAAAVNPRMKSASSVLTNYVGNFEDQNKAKELAKQMIASGADVLIHNADQAGKGMFNAAQEAKNVLVFGTNRNQNSVAPQQCLGSAVIEMPVAFVKLVQDVKESKFKAELRELNMQNGGIAVEWNAALKAKIPAPLLKKIDDAGAQIKSGQLKIARKV